MAREIFYDADKVIDAICKCVKKLGYVSSHSADLKRACAYPGPAMREENVFRAANILKSHYRHFGLKKFIVRPKGQEEFAAYAVAKEDLPDYLIVK
jgi:hypothetical protein